MAETRLTKTRSIFGFFVLYAVITGTYAADTLSANQTIRYNETIVSPQETFELGFFSPSNSVNDYVGIWYKKRAYGTVVRVANRDAPLTHTSGELTLTLQGVLSLRDATTGNVVWWSEYSSNTSVRNPVGQLLDTGNFIIYAEGDNINHENPIWQSFDIPTDTMLPGMKIGMDLVTGVETRFTSWLADNDPATGEFLYSIDTRGYPQLVLIEGIETIKFRGGPWNGLEFTENPFYKFTLVLNPNETYFNYNLKDINVLMRMVLRPSGLVEILLWTDSKQDWILYSWQPNDWCDQYAVCGAFGKCSIDNSPVCECLKGFEPKSPDQWRVSGSLGCGHNFMYCGPGEDFIKYSNLKLPDTRWSWYYQTMTLEECEMMCKRNCSCSAYTLSNISGPGSGCLRWFGDLIDIRTYAEDGDTIYIRVPPSDLDSIVNRNSSSAVGKRGSSNVGIRLRVIVPIAFVVSIILLSICLFYRFNGKKQHQQGTPINVFEHNQENRSDDEDIELPLFGLSTLLKATNNFSTNNKLGEGGYGPVYKGVLEDGKIIAVKRLAKTSNQGLHEFKNEVISISKLQHRNLVRLLGYCIEESEKMLIYEYMPNKSLDFYIFYRTQSEIFDWPTRYHIINGIARGLVYIHQDSRLRIIHRDLKASNILLDANMNPKISDFGMARSFGGNQSEANTNKVVGTYGYMAPEYARDGVFSIKSDVYSFGVVVLEIVCGEKNRGFVHKEHYNNLTGHAWGLHNEGRSLELVAKCLGESINVSQVLRSVHVGLLCVQRRPKDRPTMTSVILMLGSESALPSPKEPGFYVGEGLQDTACSYGKSSNNELTISMLDGR